VVSKEKIWEESSSGSDGRQENKLKLHGGVLKLALKQQKQYGTLKKGKKIPDWESIPGKVKSKGGRDFRVLKSSREAEWQRLKGERGNKNVGYKTKERAIAIHRQESGGTTTANARCEHKDDLANASVKNINEMEHNNKR